MTQPLKIDVHAHFLPDVYRAALRDVGLATLDGGMPVPQWSSDLALSTMDAAGIDGALLSISSPHVSFVAPRKAISLCQSINDYAAKLIQTSPSRFGAFAILPLPDMAASLVELERALDELQLDGVALPTHAAGHYLGDEIFAPLLDELDNRSTTVFIHPTSPTCFAEFNLKVPAPMIEFPFDTTRTAVSLLFSGALERYRNIKFILPHAGGTLPFLAPRIADVGSLPVLGDRALPRAQTKRNFARFYFDIAMSVTPVQIAALRTLVPTAHILYGTDGPFVKTNDLEDEVFSALQVSAQDREAIYAGNAAQLFGAFMQRRAQKL